ncbi:MAG: hypothetical protein HY985_12070 [Magnetospirillum sp.]|nr:hypothetical protein [Magnetospirillum sp.]
MRAFVVTAFAAALLAAAPALAQNAPAANAPAQGGIEVPTEIAQITVYLNSKEYIEAARYVVSQGEKDIAPECKSGNMDRVGYMLGTKPAFKEGVSYPVAGEWLDKIAINRCGKTVIHNLRVRANADKPPSFGLELPGDSPAPPFIQSGALRPAVQAAMAKSGCKDSSKVIVSDIRKGKMIEPVTIAPNGLLAGGKWSETWHFRACGKPVEIPVEFTSNGKGGATYVASAGKKQAAAKKK